jgi:hypothetical protein
MTERATMASTIDHITRTRDGGFLVFSGGGSVPFAVWPMILQT